jgi:hypothetical protein
MALMGELIREQRVDKNGRVNTKLVRPDVKLKTNGKSIPAPSAKAIKKSMSGTQQKRWTVTDKDWEGNSELSLVCKGLTPAKTFMCSDDESYDVLSVVSPDSLLPILSVGVRTSQDALKFLDEVGLSRLSTDNTGITEAAMARGLPVRPMMEFWSENIGYTDYETFMDGAETHCIMSPHVHKGNMDAAGRVLYGMVDLNDIKTIGVQRLVRADMVMSSSQDPMALNQLQKIKEGISGYDVSTMKKLLVHSGHGGTVDGTILSLANQYGAETMLGIKDVYTAKSLHGSLKYTGYDEDQKREILVLNDVINDVLIDVRRFRYSELFLIYDEYREFGMDLDQTVDGIKRRLSPAQLRAVLDGDVVPAIADGWL